MKFVVAGGLEGPLISEHDPSEWKIKTCAQPDYTLCFQLGGPPVLYVKVQKSSKGWKLKSVLRVCLVLVLSCFCRVTVCRERQLSRWWPGGGA